MSTEMYVRTCASVIVSELRLLLVYVSECNEEQIVLVSGRLTDYLLFLMRDRNEAKECERMFKAALFSFSTASTSFICANFELG